MSTKTRFRQRKLFTLHPDALDSLRRMAENDGDPVISPTRRRRKKRLFSLHPEAVECLRQLASENTEANGSMSRQVEQLIFDAASKHQESERDKISDSRLVEILIFQAADYSPESNDSIGV